MKGDIVRLDKLVPEYYVNQSRDFQTLTRLLTVGFNSAKFDSDSIRFGNDPSKVSSAMLTLLQTKIGFITHKRYLDDYIRKVAHSFYYLIRNKGSMEAIESCIRLFLQCYNLDTNAYIVIYNKVKHTDGTIEDRYEIRIGVSKNVADVTLLEDMLRFIIPTGYIITIFFYESQSQVTEIYNEYEIRTVNRFEFERNKVFGNEDLSLLVRDLLEAVDTTEIAPDSRLKKDVVAPDSFDRTQYESDFTDDEDYNKTIDTQTEDNG